MNDIKNKKVAILTDHGFEEIELTSPRKALEDAGAIVHIISMQQGNVKAWDHDHWSIEIPVDVSLKDAEPENYDALMIPGGVINPDQMRRHAEYIHFAQHFLETGMLSGRQLTSFASIKTDLINAGAQWEDKEVIEDNGLITSRSPADLEAFNKKMLEAFAEYKHLTTSSFTPES